MNSNHTIAAIAMLVGFLVLLNCFLRSSRQRLLWSSVLCLGGIWWGVSGQRDFEVLEYLSIGIFACAIISSDILLRYRIRQPVARNETPTDVGLVNLGRFLVRGLARSTWIAGWCGCFVIVVMWYMSKDLPDIARIAARDHSISIGPFLFPIWFAPGCIATASRKYFSVTERRIAWLPLILGVGIYLIFMVRPA